MKVILSIAVYLALVFALGIVTALTIRRAESEPDGLDDEF